eukprot:scaffold87_cov303-Chaetoceros_neogracile.AAC.5
MLSPIMFEAILFLNLRRCLSDCSAVIHAANARQKNVRDGDKANQIGDANSSSDHNRKATVKANKEHE